jgi:hypothetical protein
MLSNFMLSVIMLGGIILIVVMPFATGQKDLEHNPFNKRQNLYRLLNKNNFLHHLKRYSLAD